jgi:uncharacterized small protein (DUF1192 family)
LSAAELQARIAALEEQIARKPRARSRRAPDPEKLKRAQFRRDRQERARRGLYINRYYC